MEHTDIEAVIPAYALGAVDPAERSLVDRHLAAGCDPCEVLLAAYADLADGLLYAVSPVTAPPGLAADLARRMALSPAGAGAPAAASRSPDRAPPLAVAAAGRRPWLAFSFAVALLLLLATNLYWWDQHRRSQDQLAAQAATLDLIAQAPRQAALAGDAAAPQANGALFFDPGSQVGVLRIAGLPPAPAGKAYQVWLIQGGQRQSGALFRPDAGRAAVVLIHAPQSLGQYQGLGITLEPATGSPGPTSPRLAGGKF